MEGPSLYLAEEQLRPFVGKTIQTVFGNTKIGKERMDGKKILNIFSWGKHLVFQFDVFALRVHFLLFGTFEATVNGKAVTGDYKRRERTPRLALTFNNGHLEMYNGSVKYLEEKNAKKSYDFSISIMSEEWNGKVALKKIQATPNREIADALMDQTIFAGVGNIIKNEVLFLARVSPVENVENISLAKLKKIVSLARSFSQQFYDWRKIFQLRAHMQIYRKAICPRCGLKVIRKKTGKGQRWSYYCEKCQK